MCGDKNLENVNAIVIDWLLICVENFGFLLVWILWGKPYLIRAQMARQPTNENGVLTLGHIPLVHTVSAVHLANGEKSVENILEKKTSFAFSNSFVLCAKNELGNPHQFVGLDWICSVGNRKVCKRQRSGLVRADPELVIQISGIAVCVCAFSKLRFRIPNKQKRRMFVIWKCDQWIKGN